MRDALALLLTVRIKCADTSEHTDAVYYFCTGVNGFIIRDSLSIKMFVDLL